MIQPKLMRKISIVRPVYLMDSHFLKDVYKVVRKTDKENWSYFPEENEKEFALDFLNYGDLTRLVYVNNYPVAYVNCYLLKPNAHILLKDDHYHSVGLSLSDLRVTYDGVNKSYRRNSLYINVVAIVKEYQGSIDILKAIADALYDIIRFDLFYSTTSNSYPENVYAVAITRNGARMCDYFDFVQKGKSTRVIDGIENERNLYKGNMDLVVKKLEKIL
ncbi:hypothetical protein A5819_003582 [Enterococcus sp. 7E2_DIV0204]|uniref:hypothetical protein n=1 Tax=unclassified Enterococcus TaxID=2608891 RepID=UPI000A35534A|nr:MULTISPECIES: hypothetical protein [unclassified Enterococcus]OTN84032.1 hypothetical protein A5819_003582 [Enterococcus sp. 7E2_DIV0204]OTP47185.1 hypothetical protein A5884_003560 [Enterococcus sp. 7D2_DIV0200]